MHYYAEISWCKKGDWEKQWKGNVIKNLLFFWILSLFYDNLQNIFMIINCLKWLMIMKTRFSQIILLENWLGMLISPEDVQVRRLTYKSNNSLYLSEFNL